MAPKMLALLLLVEHSTATAPPTPPEGTWEKVLLTDAVTKTGARCL
jgi:hypothetical protein